VAEFVLVDTEVLVDASRRVGEAIACLRQVERQALPAASTITHMELIVGCRDKAELRKMDRFLARFHLVRLNEQVADTAVDLLRR
jgi:predicted nucleic acid-binding protein